MISLRIRAALSAVALALLTATPAGAAPLPDSHLTLRVVATGTDAPVAAAELLCHPAGGSHPQAPSACGALDLAGGNFNQLKGRTGVFCNDLYAPVTATADGLWAGMPVHWQQTFANSCGLHTRTDPVFRF
ncbi:subtilase-type protease inhibitor [Kitasatospora sp. RB6PN24]|uniref:SSI family serine proteinase inhibitor n=1 Tax=Kitasatospora humi TaxID=2893891 RepID=UPI001E45C8BA|nr:SSI family serine proteinase inhibitor [Kitasatospora humi]MCC9310191.1 subtilase-type protease inhibitor [Kitasatospora humi]